MRNPRLTDDDMGDAGSEAVFKETRQIPQRKQPDSTLQERCESLQSKYTAIVIPQDAQFWYGFE